MKLSTGNVPLCSTSVGKVPPLYLYLWFPSPKSNPKGVGWGVVRRGESERTSESTGTRNTRLC